MKTLILSILFIIPNVYGACIPHEVAISEVKGKTYVLVGEDHLKFPTLLKFHNNGIAFFGRANEGKPEGVYSYRSNCHAEIIVEFTSYFSGEVEIVLHLKPTSLDFIGLKDRLGGDLYYLQIIFEL